jgi:putative ABC transport system permease protein
MSDIKADETDWLDAPSRGGLSGALHMTRECLRSALASILSHALRSFLTMLGIIIGVASVIAVIALVQGLSESVSRQFQGLGSNMFSVRAETSIEDALRGKTNRLRLSDLEQIRRRIDDIRNITPVIVVGGGAGAEVRNGSNAAFGSLLGTTFLYQDVHQNYPLHGRFLSESDDLTRRRVVVLGDKLRRDLKLPPNAAGQHIQIAGEWFRVIGVMEPRGEIFGLSRDSYLLMPYQTAVSVNGANDEANLSIHFTVADIDAVDGVKGRIVALLRQLHGLKPSQDDDFVVEASDSLQKSFAEVTATITLVVSGVVGISLIVGGVGIMNIMLVSVTERTREIGIVKALGAPRAYILMQFLIEAVLLATIGGVCGVILGYALGFGIGRLIPNFPDPAVPWWAMLGACGFSGLIGMVFGILPASNAANLTPIEALRYE